MHFEQYFRIQEGFSSYKVLRLCSWCQYVLLLLCTLLKEWKKWEMRQFCEIIKFWLDVKYCCFVSKDGLIHRILFSLQLYSVGTSSDRIMLDNWKSSKIYSLEWKFTQLYEKVPTKRINCRVSVNLLNVQLEKFLVTLISKNSSGLGLYLVKILFHNLFQQHPLKQWK